MKPFIPVRNIYGPDWNGLSTKTFFCWPFIFWKSRLLVTANFIATLLRFESEFNLKIINCFCYIKRLQVSVMPLLWYEWRPSCVEIRIALSHCRMLPFLLSIVVCNPLTQNKEFFERARKKFKRYSVWIMQKKNVVKGNKKKWLSINIYLL